VSAHVIWIFGEGHSSNASASGSPGLDFDDNFAVFLARQFFGCGNSFISGCGGAAARNLESVRGENCFALIFVKSCHRWVLFRMKTPNVQQLVLSVAKRSRMGLMSKIQLRSAELSLHCWALRFNESSPLLLRCDLLA